MLIKNSNDTFRNRTSDLPACSAMPLNPLHHCVPLERLCFNKTGISRNYDEEDLEICAFEVETEASKLISLSLYRALPGCCSWFVSSSNGTLK